MTEIYVKGKRVIFDDLGLPGAVMPHKCVLGPEKIDSTRANTSLTQGCCVSGSTDPYT